MKKLNDMKLNELLIFTGGVLFGVSVISLMKMTRWMGKAKKEGTNEKEITADSKNTLHFEGAEYELGKHIKQSFGDLVGNTPIIFLESLSRATGCIILGKAEFMNGGGSIKDRAAKYMIDCAFTSAQLRKGGTVVEGTVGSTGIALTLQAKSRGCKSVIYLPNDVSPDKYHLLTTLGARIITVPPVSIVDPGHYVNQAKAYRGSGDADDGPVFFADQFENPNNYLAHYTSTAPEIFNQLNASSLPCLSALVMGAGTGGTISGIAKYLKEKYNDMRVFLVDPNGSGLFNKINFGVMYSKSESEGTRKRIQTDSIIEGVGINRITHNMLQGLDLIDEALHCSDEEALYMSRYLIENEGLFLGGSSALNCVGAVKVAKKLKKGSVILTILCDGGQRYNSNFYNASYLASKNLPFHFDDCKNLDFIHFD